MPDFQLPPLSDGLHYKPRHHLLGDFQLKLGADVAPSLRGWTARTNYGRLVYLGPTLPGDVDDPLTRTMGKLGPVLSAPGGDPSPIAARYFSEDLLRKIAKAVYDAASDRFWSDISVPPDGASIGKIDPSGRPRYTDLDGLSPGKKLDSDWVKPIRLGKWFGSSSHADLTFQVTVDTGATKPQQLISGGGVTLGWKTATGAERSVVLSAGRPGPNGFWGGVMLRFGPDIDPDPVGH
jgi:hypothetical protein